MNSCADDEGGDHANGHHFRNGLKHKGDNGEEEVPEHIDEAGVVALRGVDAEQEAELADELDPACQPYSLKKATDNL